MTYGLALFNQHCTCLGWLVGVLHELNKVKSLGTSVEAKSNARLDHLGRQLLLPSSCVQHLLRRRCNIQGLHFLESSSECEKVWIGMVDVRHKEFNMVEDGRRW